jgi:6 kDa early secretory antigenic target
MPEGNIKVTFSSLEALAGDIKTRVDAIEGDIEKLRSDIGKVQSEWEGGASDGFQLVKGKWEEAANNLKMVLKRIETAVITSTDGYRDMEDRNRRRWDQ